MRSSINYLISKETKQTKSRLYETKKITYPEKDCI